MPFDAGTPQPGNRTGQTRGPAAARVWSSQQFEYGSGPDGAPTAVPLADRHAVSEGMTTVADPACFGVYADREVLPDAERLARSIDEAITELLGSA